MEKKLAVEPSKKQITKFVSVPKDIIILKKCNDIIEYDTNGNKIQRTVYKKVNISKLVNETKKLVKRDLALEKIEELKKVVTSK